MEAVWYLAEEEGDPVRPSRLAEWLGVRAPSVTEAIQRLRRDGLVELAGGSDRGVRLTPLGEAEARSIVRRHRILERWLAGDLGLDWVSADEEADRLAAVFSESVLDRLYEHLGRPATCPHGNTIPGALPPAGEPVPLTELAPGRGASVVRISELAEHESRDILRLLEQEQIMPGVIVTVMTPGDPDVVTVDVDGRKVALSRHTAQSVFVEAG